MKKIKQKTTILLVIILFPFFTLFNECSDPECTEFITESLPDLLVQSFSLANAGEINVGDAVNMAITVGNVIETANTCYETLSAENHNYNVDVYWKDVNSKDDSFEKVASGTYDVSSLMAGSSFSTDDGKGEINVPGEYYFKGVEDSKEVIVEREEKNNDKDADIGNIDSKSKSTHVFYVAPTEEYYKKLKSGEPIEYFTFHKTENFVSYTSKKHQIAN